ncbi:homoserine kinase [Oscillatoria sp. FACHB-1406]|uniref:homoserine kinase n=1 Tax=Oscillatoria sp. FACHB-1406 TaxID=2692846 RepID=UPI0016820416|nr:homoserine kinase [Oscillatoria sp. FACHB-1406]MBD2576329.1 homoserine kinase [Oscillatoria sp. FACHB-1406]
MSAIATVIVPGTTANLGSGFDCIGAALTLYNQFRFTAATDTAVPLKISVQGEEAKGLQADKSNLVYRAFCKLYDRIGQPAPPVEIEIKLGVPLSRGLGSSATAIIGGLVGANRLAGNALSVAEIMEIAIAMEGHPDNVVPTLLGNCQLSVKTLDKWEVCAVPWHQAIVPIVAIPDFELSTEAARAVLPTSVSRADAIFNISRMGMLVRGLGEHHPDWLRAALDDALHQPYRQSLIRGYEEVQAAAIAAGAYGMAISGAGPALLALADSAKAKTVAEAMQTAWEREGVRAEALLLALDAEGARIIDN